MFDGPWESCIGVRGLNPSECASWVQAWGTIIAIAAAVAVALWQRQVAMTEAKNRSRAAARVAASGVLLTIDHILVCIDFVSAHIEVLAGDASFDPNDQIDRLQALRHPSDFERLSLIEWEPECAKHLALGAGLLAKTESALVETNQLLGVGSDVDEDVVEEMLDALKMAQSHYESAVPLLRRVAG